jgi:hypothetical protein
MQSGDVDKNHAVSATRLRPTYFRSRHARQRWAPRRALGLLTAIPQELLETRDCEHSMSAALCRARSAPRAPKGFLFSGVPGRGLEHEGR